MSKPISESGPNSESQPISEKIEKAFSQLFETVHHLRAPGGCPWDRAQTHQSLRPFVIEEAYEVVDVLDEIKDTKDLKNPSLKSRFQEELGDLLMQVMLHAEMTREENHFDVADVAIALNDKLIRRHPHVFALGSDGKKAENAEKALQNWEAQKAKEKKPDESVLSSLPKSLPALQKTARMIEKVSKVGFQWSDLKGPIEKLDEELEELKTELNAFQTLEKAPSQSQVQTQDRVQERDRLKQRVSDELGDLLFSLCNIAHFVKLNPEDALRGTLNRFESRFLYIEAKLKQRGKRPEDASLSEMDELWNDAKRELS